MLNRRGILQIPVFLHVAEAKYLHDYVIWVRFNDGVSGEVDLREELTGEVFAPLQDLAQFQRFLVDPEMETIVWENGEPEFLCSQIRELA